MFFVLGRRSSDGQTHTWRRSGALGRRPGVVRVSRSRRAAPEERCDSEAPAYAGETARAQGPRASADESGDEGERRDGSVDEEQRRWEQEWFYELVARSAPPVHAGAELPPDL